MYESDGPLRNLADYPATCPRYRQYAWVCTTPPRASALPPDPPVVVVAGDGGGFGCLKLDRADPLILLILASLKYLDS
jgi:hypothetical protein